MFFCGVGGLRTGFSMQLSGGVGRVKRGHSVSQGSWETASDQAEENTLQAVFVALRNV